MTVVLVSTGGTIASTGDKAGNAAPEITGDELIEAVPEVNTIADVCVRDFSNVPSPHFTIGDMHDLTDVLSDLDDDPEIEGVIVTQGTDILEESSYFASLCYDGSTPVVFTGAMRNPSLPSADGPGNLVTAIRAATDQCTASIGVALAFNYRLFDVNDVTKANSMNPDSFRSPEFGPLAVLDEDRLIWRRQPTESNPTFSPDPDALTSDIPGITVTADMPTRQFDAAHDAVAVCFAATGAGHVPPTILPSLESLSESGVPLIATTRCHEGRLARSTYGFRGSEQTLRELGCYFSDHNLAKTRIKAIVSTAANRLDDAFERPLIQ